MPVLPLAHPTSRFSAYITMFSKVLVNFTGIFLILYISASSATQPTPTAQPGEAHKINDNIHARFYDQYQCVPPFSWLRRECVGALGSRNWQDVCAYSTYANPSQLVYDNKPGTCPEGTACLNSLLFAGRRFINCVPVEQRQIIGNKRKRDPQIGTSDMKRARPELGNTQFEYSVTIDHDMTEAAVAAVVKGECRPVDVHCRIFLCSCGDSAESFKFR